MNVALLGRFSEINRKRAQTVDRDGQILETRRSHRHRRRTVQRVQVQRRPTNGIGRPELCDGHTQVLSAWRSQQSVGSLRTRQQRRRRLGVRQAFETLWLFARSLLSSAHGQTSVPQSRSSVCDVRGDHVRLFARKHRRVRRIGGRVIRF